MSDTSNDDFAGLPKSREIPPVRVPGAAVDGEHLPAGDGRGGPGASPEGPARSRRWSSAAIVLASALGALVGGLLVAAGLMWALGYAPGSTPLVRTTETPSASRSGSESANPVTIKPDGNPDVSEAVSAKVVPSVVNINVSATSTDMFGRMSESAGNGSGVIVREDGYILTNNHVIAGATDIRVAVGVKEMPATVVGTDPSSDLAVIKVDATGLPAVEIGSSADLKVGQYVMAVGSPFGLEKTVTVGIVSALNRSEVMQGQTDITTYTNLIQTDAAINPGNSGGALVDGQGRLVGINTLIQSTSGSSAGIGFAIPVDFAMDIGRQLIANGKASHPYLGVSTGTIDENVAAQYSLPVDSGAMVVVAEPDGPAAKAGIRREDIIVGIGGTEITSVEDVFAAIRQHKVGDAVEVEFVRDGKNQTVSVTLGDDADRP